MENVSTDLKKIGESKKDSLRRAVENLTLQWNDLEEYLDSTQSSFGQRLAELESREKQLVSAQLLLEESRKEQDATQKSIESREKQLDSTRLSFEEQSRELDFIRKSIDKSVLELQSKEKEMNSVQQSVERRMRELESKEKQRKKRRKELGSKEKQLDSLQKSIEERRKELELREKQYEERVKQLELKEMQCGKYVHSKLKVEQEEFSGDHDGGHSLPARLQFSITMDGRALQIFLNEREDEHESICPEVYNALQMSAIPATLVLDAVQGFFPPHTKKGDKEFEAIIIRKSCTLLLAQLMRILPQITPRVKEEASKLAVDWKAKLEVRGENSLEVLGFLQLVGIYRLVSNFDSDEVFKLFETIPQHREAPELCRILGFADKVPDFVQDLIKRRQNLAAIRFIHAFKLVDKFPTVPILEDYFKCWKNIADKTCMSESLTKRQIKMARQSLVALRAVIKCIEDHKLEIGYPPDELEKCISMLSEKVNGKCIAPANTKSQPQQQQRENNCGTLTGSTTKIQQQQQQQSEENYGAPGSSAINVQHQQQKRKKHPSTAVSRETPNAAIGAASTFPGVFVTKAQQQSLTKRHRTDVSNNTPNASIRAAASNVHWTHSTLQHPAVQFSGQVAPPCVALSRGHYDFRPIIPVSSHMRSSYLDGSVPSFRRDPPRELCYYDEPVTFCSTKDTFSSGYYDRRLPSGGDAVREGGYFDGPTPCKYGYDVAPPFHPPVVP